MRRSTFVFGFAVALVPLTAWSQGGSVRETALARIPRARVVAADPEVLKAVLAKNATRETMNEIRRRDREWSSNPQAPLRKLLTTSACAARLRDLSKEDPLIVEVILMDSGGANVCVSRETSDYWQGDEAKFQKIFREGKEVFVDEPSFDGSTNTYAIQLSVPVLDAKTKAGVLTFTLRVRKEDVVDKVPK